MAEAEENKVESNNNTASLMISYSRKDKEFVRQLYDGLVERGFPPGKDSIWVDWEGIPLSADWMAEITKGIQSANAFIFVISPDSVASEVCQKEIEIAVAANKRFIPILYREPGKDAKLHEKISSHNWIFIHNEEELEKNLPALVDAINTDLDWLDRHTYYYNRANEWQAAGRNVSSLLRGKNLEDAESFINEGAAGKEPVLTPLHIEYVEAARKNAVAVRRRNRIIAAVVGVALLALSIFALIQWGFAEEEKVRADDQASTAVANQYIANTAEAVAVIAQEEAERNAREANALALSAEAINQKDSDTQLSLMLALLSIQETAQDDIVPLLESKSALFSSLNTPNVIQTWDNDGEIVWSVAYDPNGVYIATGDRAGVLKVYDLESRELVYSKQFDDDVTGVDFSPDGEILGVASSDGTARVYDVASGDELFSLAGHDGYGVYDIKFSPDGNSIATGGGDWNVKIWDAGSGSIRVTLPSHTQAVNAVAFSPDSTRLVSGSDDDTVILWDLETNSLLNKFRPDGFETDGNYINTVAFNPWGDRIMAGGYQTVVVWDAFDYSEIHRLRGNQADVYTVAFAPDGLSMLTASSGVKIWDWFYGTERFNLSSHRGEVTSAAYSSDGQFILTGSWDNTTKLWSANLKIETLRLTQHDDVILDANYSPDGQWIVTSDGLGLVFVHNAQTGEVVYEFEAAFDEWINAATFNPQNGQQFVTGDDMGQLQLWELGESVPLWSITAHDLVNSAKFSPDGRRIVTAGDDGLVNIWDAVSGELLRELVVEEVAYEARFSPDGSRIVTADKANVVQVWDAENGELIMNLEGHTDEVLTVAYSHDGKYIYSGSYDNTIRKWDAENGETILTLTGHTGRVLSLDISPDDTLLASGSADTTVKVWEVWSGKEIYNYQGNNEDSKSVAFSPDGNRVLTASLDNTSKEFTIDYDELLQIAQEYELRPLTLEECQRFLYRDNCSLTLFGETVSNTEVTASTAVQSTPTPVPQTQQPQPSPTPTAMPSVPPSTDEAFYTEEFDADLDAWGTFMVTGLENQVNAGLENGSLFVQLSPLEDKVPRYYVVNDSFTYSDVQVEAVVTNNGNNANGVSLVCHYNGSGWYEFTLSNAGLYSINAYDPDNTATQGYVQLAGGGSAAIKLGRSTNTYTAICNGSELTLIVNDTLVNTITDTRYNFTEGNIGIAVSSPELLPVDVTFESLSVSSP